MASITVDRQSFQVRENAEAAIRRLRDPKQDKAIWIDAICINQNDNDEKAVQLPMMAKIYDGAQRVCIWLGEGTDCTIQAIDHLRHKNQTFRAGWNMWRTQRGNGKLMLPFKDQMSSIQESSDRAVEFSTGEIRELLSRPWWGRTWIVQEAIAGRKPFFLVGNDTLDWDEISQWKRRSGQVNLGYNSASPFGLDTPPRNDIFDQLYHVLSGFREKWSNTEWNVPVLDLLYRFRHLQCASKRDKIYGLLGLTSLTIKTKFRPNYNQPTNEVYRDFSLALIDHTGTLDILNYKREWDPNQISPLQIPVSAYSMLEQAKYHDTYAAVVNPDGSKPRKGWARLPPGWERRVRNNKPYYYNWAEDKEYPDSPLKGKPPAIAQHVEEQKVCPPGWTKKYDNLGRHRVFYEPQNAKAPNNAPVAVARFTLPSWVPNWSKPTHHDSRPLLDLGEGEQIFFASGTQKAELLDRPNKNVLGLTGIQFDRIAELAEPWHPEDEYPPMSRKHLPVLAQWEEMALANVSNCPYGGSSGSRAQGNNGRANALWRTYLADAPKPEHASPAQDRWLVECWYDRKGWAVKPPTYKDLLGKSLMQTAVLETEYTHVSTKMVDHFLELVSAEFMRKLEAGEFTDEELEKKAVKEWHKSHDYNKYGAIATRIAKACSHRALYVSEKGYMGLAPWNARKGDVVAILHGAKTPFLLRERPRSGRFRLIGETFLYGIMGGEALDMGFPVREFDLL
ncbi:heterokaryon incompatibility protein-domain-containing protein [Xylariales sp. PMI_506]|nr:heterokaryon incompatibility protein-domain-containing protein [Xylariales sp. PMI_506]